MAPEEPRRLHTSVLPGTGKTPRKARKARAKAAAQRRKNDAAERKAARDAQARLEREEARNTHYLPRSGEPGPAALRTPMRFRARPHQDTSAALRGAYPFLAEGGIGTNGVLIGQDMYSGGSFVFDAFELYRQGVITAPNMTIAGIVGAGKSALIKSLYTRSVAFGRKVYLPCDPKGEHSAIAEAIGGKAIQLAHGSGARLNPLDEGHRPAGTPDETWRQMLSARRRDLLGALAAVVLERHLTALEHTAIDLALQETVRDADVPILPMVVDRILDPRPDRDGDITAEDGREVGHALRRLVSGDLSGLFDGPSTVRFDPSLPMMSLDMSQVVENASLVSVLMTCASAWMEASLLDPSAGKRLVVYDEAWRVISEPALLRRMDSQWRMSRHLGISNVLIFHKISDLETVGDQGTAMRALANSLLANAEIRVIYRQASDQLSSAATALGLTGTEQSLLPGLGIGQGLWRIKDHAYLVQHQLHPDELEMFDTRSRLM
ncbi:ATP-binding protein [Nesterenkonia alkaliphila]|uniref:ATP-binding protein n=1 Tax=Nesterenkonia alkaliphila TaxID=1463631 RepID=A0A7K1UF45_9MICC|nr:ATP-binding protein [Nesterenkonia alkaliphila]MVT25069.1 ATP-binding protein [Nesterenkonia alkaliphila]GFZ83212.1 ATP-binding protein [Nesterenkonia alkaliphila]